MKPKIKMPVIVEGKYDKIKLSSVIDATVITTDGFGIFNDEKKRAYLRRICSGGVIIATDSDGAGKVIRGHLSGVLPPEKVHNVYIPKIKGKEKRKASPSKEGFLGVEGMDADVIRGLFEPFAEDENGAKCEITRADLYGYGLCGKPDSAAKRKALCGRLSLPDDLSSKALCEALGRLYNREELDKAVKELFGEDNGQNI